MYIDTHVHFYDEWLLPDAEAAIGRALDAGVGKMIQPDIDRSEREGMFRLTEAHPEVLFPMLGLYPGSVRDDWEEEIEALLKWRDRGIVAVGEIGLDYHEGKEYADLQKKALRVQLELAAEWNLPVNIHLRDAWEDFFSILSDCRHLGLRGNLHCFTASYEIFSRAQKYGDFSVGIGGVVTFRNASLAETVKSIPLDKILLETDAPYMAPVPFRGRRNESAYIPYIAEKIALQKGLSIEEVEAATTANAEKMFGI